MREIEPLTEKFVPIIKDISSVNMDASMWLAK